MERLEVIRSQVSVHVDIRGGRDVADCHSLLGLVGAGGFNGLLERHDVLHAWARWRRRADGGRGAGARAPLSAAVPSRSYEGPHCVVL